MKKVFKIFGLFILILVTAAMVIPYLYKDEIKTAVIDAAKSNINADVNFSDVDLSLFSSFPYLTVSINDLVFINKEPFSGDTLFSANSVGAAVDFLSVISGEKLNIKSIYLDSPKILAYILKDGSNNFNIAPDNSDSETIKDSSTPKSEFNITLESYSVTNGAIAFVDQETGILVALKNLNHTGNGDFTQDDFVLNTVTSVDELTVEMDGIKYLNKVKSDLEMNIGINVPGKSFTFKENEVKINNLTLNFDGNISMLNDNINTDISFSSPNNNFKDIISLIPAIYKNDFTSIETSGEMNFDGKIKGTLSENSLPAFDINLKIINGNLKYPDLPTPINNVNISLNITNPDGVVDNTIVNLSKIYLELGPEQIEGKFVLKNPESGPNVDIALKGSVDLEKVKNSLDLQNIEELKGIIKSDFRMKGNVATVQKNYENVDVSGSIYVSDLFYKGVNFDQLLSISSAELKFNPKNISLSNFNAKIGESDIKANGSLNNLVSFAISDGILFGNLNISSNFFDFNPYMLEDNVANANEGSAENNEMKAFDVPENINFTLNSEIKKLLYDNLELNNVRGEIIVRESKVYLENLNMNLLEGSLSGNGSYSKTKLQENPDIKFDLNVKDFDVKQTYEKFVSVKQFAPIAKYIQGNFSSNLKINTSLDNSLMPIWETFFSNGFMNLKSAEIKGFKPFSAVGTALNIQELANPKLENVNPKFEIKNGRFYVKPFNYKVGNYNVTLAGSNGIDQSIDYQMEFDIPTEKLKNQTNSAISGLLGKDINLVKSSSVKAKALIKGTVDSPKVTTSVADVASNVVKDVTSAVVDEAKAQADSLKAEAEKILKEEAKKKEEELKKKLEEEAKKKLKNLFKWG